MKLARESKQTITLLHQTKGASLQSTFTSLLARSYLIFSCLFSIPNVLNEKRLEKSTIQPLARQFSKKDLFTYFSKQIYDLRNKHLAHSTRSTNNHEGNEKLRKASGSKRKQKNIAYLKQFNVNPYRTTNNKPTDTVSPKIILEYSSSCRGNP